MILRHISLSVKLQRHTHVRCRITRREMRDPCVAVRFASGAHITRASRRQAGPPNPLVAARLHGSAPHARSASPHVDPCQHVKYPLVPVRFALTRHAACMLNAADQVGYPTSPRPSRRIGVAHIHTLPTFTHPSLGSRSRRTRGRDDPAALPPPPRPAGPPRSHIASALKGRTWQWESATHACTEM
jgi:hypothetical protein